MKLKRFFRVGGVSRCWLVKKRCGLCSMKCAIKYKCANKVGLLCFVACWLHAQGSFFKQHGAGRQSRIPEGSQRRKHWDFSGFVFDFMRHAPLKCGWLLSEFELGLFLRKIKNEWMRDLWEGKEGRSVYWGKGKVYIGRMWNKTKEREQRRRMDWVEDKQV